MTPSYFVIEKKVGETPLQATERGRTEHTIAKHIPLAYAGRLDPVASGALLILVGDECKKQDTYHTLDKEYHFAILFGIESDTGDVLGLPNECTTHTPPTKKQLLHVIHDLIGPISLPYPQFSSKTVRGKPLHVWALEKRLNEIEIPVRHSHIYSISLSTMETVPANVLFDIVHKKIDTIPEVQDVSKILGRDFRRTEIHNEWRKVEMSSHASQYTIAHLTCRASSGTYMRSLASIIAQKLGTCGLAYSIHRTTIGSYIPLTKRFGFWKRKFV